MTEFSRDLKKYMSYTVYASKSRLKSDVANSPLGCAWWILTPALDMVMYFVIFCYLLNRSEKYSLAFIYSGLIFWRLFRNTIVASITMIKSYRAILLRVYIPKYFLIIQTLFVNLFKLLCSIPIILIILAYYNAPVSLYILELPLLLLLWIIFVFGLSCIIMHLGVYFRDLGRYTKYIMRFLMYFSGVIFSVNRFIGDKGDLLIKFNPISFFVNSMRDCLIYAKGCDLMLTVVWGGISVLLAILGIYLIYIYEDNYLKVV